MAEKTVRTIADIARLAGVSKSTVSRALSDSSLISQETKERVQAIARLHEFKIHQPARRLSLQQSNTIAFVTHGYHPGFSLEDLFQFEILGAISSALALHNYDLLMAHVNPYDTEWASQYLDSGRVDGFILMTSTRKNIHIHSLVDLGAPFIVWGVPLPDTVYPSVTGDNLKGGRLATEHLLRSGRRKIAFLGGPDGELEVAQRFKGYETALESTGLATDPKLIAHGDFSSASGATATEQLLEKVPDLDAVFANSDLMAIAAIKKLQENGYRVPEDVAVVGYDNLSIAQHNNPPLTTVNQNIPEAGRLLVQNLIQYIETGLVTNVSIPVNLVVRKSA